MTKQFKHYMISGGEEEVYLGNDEVVAYLNAHFPNVDAKAAKSDAFCGYAVPLEDPEGGPMLTSLLHPILV